MHYRTLVFHRGCQDAIDNFLIEEKSRIREEEARKKKLEEDGEYEVSRIMDVQILDGGTDFFFLISLILSKSPIYKFSRLKGVHPIIFVSNIFPNSHLIQKRIHNQLILNSC